MDISDVLDLNVETEMPPPIPGMRPPLGSPGGPVPAPKSSMGFVMPIYTTCIIVFFVYTLVKLMFRRAASPYDPVAPDPQFRRRVFRDDSRSSPDKLGKKEADTIVTAISGLVAEVTQQMEASYAQNQQRQDVQDNARPYTNGTILLNTGPVQIVASEYKEASKEKTPEPVHDKEVSPEPKEAEPIKVAKEPSLEPDVVVPEYKEPVLERKESPDVSKPSPEPAQTLEQTEAALETVVVKESSPDISSTQEHNDPIPEPDIPITESEEVRASTPESIRQSPEISPNVAKESFTTIKKSVSDSSELAPEPNLVEESTLDVNVVPQETDTSIHSADTAQTLRPKYSSLVEEELKDTTTEPKELTSQSKELTPQPKDASPELTETTSETKEPASEPKEPSPELKQPVSVPKEPTPEPKESTPQPNEYIIDVKESLSKLDELIPEPAELISEPELIPEPKETSFEPKKPSPEPKEPTPEIKESSPDLEEFELRDATPDDKQSTPESDLVLLDSKEPTPDTKESSPIEASIPEHTELTQKHPTQELTESSQALDAPDVECSPESSVDTSELKGPTPQSKESTPEPKFTTELEVQGRKTEENASVPEGSLIDLNEAIAELDDTAKEQDEDFVKVKGEKDRSPDDVESDTNDEILKVLEDTDSKDVSKTKATEKFLEEERFVVVKQSTPDVEENKPGFPKVAALDEEEIENAAVKVVGMEMTAHPADGSEWPRDLRPPPSPAPPRPSHEADEVKSIFLETEIPQQSRVLVAQFAEDREESHDKPRPAKHAPLVVSGKMTLSLIQDAPRETPERDPESTMDDFTTASAVTQPAAEKGEIESDEEVDEEIEVEEIEEEFEEEEEEEPAPVNAVKK